MGYYRNLHGWIISASASEIYGSYMGAEEIFNNRPYNVFFEYNHVGKQKNWVIICVHKIIESHQNPTRYT